MKEQKIPHIFSEAIKNARLKKGMEIHELADTLCLSNKHIIQIEEGGDLAFFSKSHKVQVAKKVGSFLGLPEEQIIELVPKAESTEVVLENNSVADKQVKNKVIEDQSSSIKELPQFGSASLGAPSFKNKNAVLGSGLLILVAGLFWFFNPWIESTSDVKNSEGESAVNVAQESSKSDGSTGTLDAESKRSEVEMGSKNIEKTVCDIDPQAVPVFKPLKANSAGNYVYLVSKTEQTICVVDAANKKQLVKLNALEKRNVNGVGPFMILSPDFSKVDVYYQGWRVPVSPGINTLRTEEQFAKGENSVGTETSNSDQK